MLGREASVFRQTDRRQSAALPLQIRQLIVRRPSLARGEAPWDQCVVIAQLNIEHFRRKLATEQDTAKRLKLLRLLAEEEAKLASFRDASGTHKA